MLWHKKYQAVAVTRIEPMRMAYYYHTPEGRLRAKVVAEPVPPFYARVALHYKPPAVRARVKLAVYRPPLVRVRAHVNKAVWIDRPRVGWYAGVRARIRPAPVKVAWYVRPKAPRAHVMIGAKATGRIHAMFKVVPPRPRVKAVIRVGGPGVAVRDHRMRGGAQVKAGMKARMKAGVKVGGGAVEVRDHRGGAVRAGAVVKGVVGGAAVKVRDHRRRVGGALKGAVGVGVGVKVRDHRTGKAQVQVRDHRTGKARVQGRDHRKKKKKKRAVKGKASIHVKGGLKIGN